jgi:hypothetical protein
MAIYRFRIHHVRGTENARVDALSRRLDLIDNDKEEASLLKRVTITIDWTKPIEDFIDYYRYNTPEIQRLRE